MVHNVKSQLERPDDFQRKKKWINTAGLLADAAA